MGRTTALKPRVAEAKTIRVETINPDSWRADKGKTAERGYGGKWQRERLVFLDANPLCLYCQREGRVTAANVVDHSTPHRGDWSIFWDRKGWVPLCTHCHNSVKQREEKAERSR